MSPPRWESGIDDSDSHWLFITDDHEIVGEVWRDGLRWRAMLDTPQVVGVYMTLEAARANIEQAYDER